MMDKSTMKDLIYMRKIADILANHRDDEYITCKEHCWCWRVDGIITKKMIEKDPYYVSDQSIIDDCDRDILGDDAIFFDGDVGNK